MMTIYRWENGGLKETPDFAPSCWINLVEPTTTELESVVSYLNVPRDFLTDPSTATRGRDSITRTTRLC